MSHQDLQFSDGDGKPCSGGRLFSYVAGSTKPQATYSDDTLTRSNRNPITLDSAGRPSQVGPMGTIWLSPNPYKFVLESSTGAVVWTADNVANTGQLRQASLELARAAAPLGHGLINAAGTQPRAVNILDHGADPTGVRNSTAAWVSALAVAATTQGEVYCPAGTYLTSTITVPANVRVSGINQGSPTKGVNGGCRIRNTGGGYVISFASDTVKSYYSGGMDHVYVDCSGGLATVGLYVGVAVFNRFTDITTDSCSVAGTVVDGTQNSLFEDFDNRSSAIGLYVINGASNNLFLRVESELSTSACIRLNYDATFPNHVLSSAPFGALQNTFERSVFEDGGTYAYALDAPYGVANTFSDDGFGDAPEGTTKSVLHFGSLSSLNRVVRPSIQVTHDVNVISNGGYYNQFLDGDVTLVANCHAITAAAPTVIENWYISSSDPVSGSCFFNNAVSTSPAGASYAYSYTPLQKSGPTPLKPSTIPGVPINNFYNTSLGQLQGFNGETWYPVNGHVLQAFASSPFTLTHSLERVPGATVSLDYNGVWEIEATADVSCGNDTTAITCQIHMNLETANDLFYSPNGIPGTISRSSLKGGPWYYSCTTCDITPVPAFLTAALSAGGITPPSSLSQLTTQITARYIHP